MTFYPIIVIFPKLIALPFHLKFLIKQKANLTLKPKKEKNQNTVLIQT